MCAAKSLVKFFKRTTGLLGTLALLSNTTVAFAQDNWPRDEGQQHDGFKHDEGRWDDDDHDHEGLSLREKIELLHRKVKFVFVIFHENESFDHYFGTYPGANGLFSAPRGASPANKTPSFVQKYLDTSLNTVTISPFLMPQAVVTASEQIVPIYPADEISVDHSHQGMANSLHVDPTTGIAANDRYAMDQGGLTTDAGGNIVTNNGRVADLNHARAKAESRDRHWPHRLRHDSLHVALGEELRAVRQLPSDDRRTFDPECDRADRRPVRSDAMGPPQQRSPHRDLCEPEPSRTR